MRVLFTSDWQCSTDNLETCEKAVEEVLRLKKSVGFQAITMLGDMKESYSPVAVPVVNFAVNAIGRFVDAGLRVLIDLGNHDRVNLHVDKQNWFPVLRKAGAEAFDDPTTVKLGEGYEIRFLPFRINPVLLKVEARDLAKGADKKKSVLVFHADVGNSKYNVLSRSSSSLRIQDLLPEQYLYVIGGHIHLQQQIHKNAYYVGSPFCCDWGEANQRKGYLLVDFSTGELQSIKSKIPGWYDPSWPRFEENKPVSWNGCRVRIRVPVENIRDVEKQLEKVKEESGQKYAGANVTVLPDFQKADSTPVSVLTSHSDEKKIEAYMKTTLPSGLHPYRQRIKGYLLERLKQAGRLEREGKELLIKEVNAENFLSFEHLKMKFDPGLLIVEGKNLDWHGRSNGAGKTSLLMPVAVGLCGATLKGQKFDGWTRRGSDEKAPAYVNIKFEDHRGRECEILRSRRPQQLLKILVNGEPINEGNKQNLAQTTIETLTGYTWETLSNTLYIDQSRSHLLLTGTSGERKTFLANLQNLERFDVARRFVAQERATLIERVSKLAWKIKGYRSSLKLSQKNLDELGKLMGSGEDQEPQETLDKIEKLYKEEARNLVDWKNEAATQKKNLNKEIDETETTASEAYRLYGELSHKLSKTTQEKNRLNSIKGAACHVCGQKVKDEYAQQRIKVLEKKEESYQSLVQQHNLKNQELQKKRSALKKELNNWGHNSALEEHLQWLRVRRERALARKEQFQRSKKLFDRMNAQVKGLEEKITEHQKKEEKATKWLKVLDYAISVFNRSGLPSQLNAQLCPLLNATAQKYSELFAQKEIQVVFEVDEEGMLDVNVVNAHGGASIGDQSAGEMKMASLVTSFAVRQAAPKTNLLILDEPGDGLDSASATQFARGLKEVVKDFGTIIVVTHNPAILGELASERTITVVKQAGISRLEN